MTEIESEMFCRTGDDGENNFMRVFLLRKVFHSSQAFS